jgi:drug/metabolite transporter (DMT)-like permease
MVGRQWLLWCSLATLWGSSFLAIRIAVHAVDPILVVAWRMGIGALALMFFLWAFSTPLRLGQRGWAIAFVVGISGNVAPFLLISYAEMQVESGLAALIMAIAPVITLVAAPSIHPDEQLTSSKMTGGIVGLIGVLFLVGPAVLLNIGNALMPQIALLAAACCYSFTALFSRRFSHPQPLHMAAGSVIIGAGIMVLLVILSGSGASLPMGDWGAVVAILYLGLGPTALAAAIYFTLLPQVGASRLQQVNFAVPAIGVILGVIVLGEVLTWNVWIALPTIMLAVWLVSRPAKREAVPTSPSASSAR